MRKKDFRILIDLIDEAENMILELTRTPMCGADQIKLKRINLRLERIADILFDYEPLR